MKVVLGTDGSDHSKFAGSFLRRYPLGTDAHVLCCSAFSTARIVTATSHPFLGPIISDQIAQAVEDAREAAARWSDAAAEEFVAEGYSAEPHVLEGDPAMALSDFAREESAAFVCVGSRGEGSLEALFLGSVARSLANFSDIDLLVCRDKESADPGLRVIFATDHSDFADRVTAKLPSLVSGRFKTIEALSIMDPSSRDLLYALPNVEKGENFAELEQGMESWLGNASAKTAEQLSALAERVDSKVLYGHDREKIVERAKELDADLIIMGAKGRSGLSRLLLGSVSHYVLHRAACSVMIVRA
jgi:nucleotide-binding universal stress UspA family protein